MTKKQHGVSDASNKKDKSDKTSAWRRVDGSDMEPKFRAGQFVFCDPEREPVDRDFVLVRTATAALPVLRQLIIEPSGARYLRALNLDGQQSIVQLSEAAKS